jgi:hypothetical protein
MMDPAITMRTPTAQIVKPAEPATAQIRSNLVQLARSVRERCERTWKIEAFCVIGAAGRG